MSDEKVENRKKIIGGAGITAGRDVSFGDVSGQIAVGQDITQTQTLSSEDKKDLFDSLQQFQKEVIKLGLPPDEATNVSSNVNLAIKEAEKEQPDAKKIQDRFQGALDTIKEVGDTIETVSKWEWTKKILKVLGKIGLAILL